MSERFSLLTQSEVESIVSEAVTQALEQFTKRNKIHSTIEQTQSGDPLLTMKKVCEELDLSRTRVNQLVNAGTLKIERLPGSRRIYFKRSSILKAFDKTKGNR